MRIAVALGALALAAALAGAGGRDTPRIDLDAVPPVDVSRHRVPLADVVFDTFDGSYVRLPSASQAEIGRLRDAIRPIYSPRYGSARDLPWLSDDDVVLGYVDGDTAYAYPIKVLNLRELVNDEIGSEPILVSYCPLCASAIVWSRRVGDETLLFGNTSALYESDLLMYDHATGSYWFQVAGRAIVGELTGTQLRALPSTTMQWRDFRRLHPDARLLVGDGEEKFGRRYATDKFDAIPYRTALGRFGFPVSRERLDLRLPISEVVLAVEAGGAVRAYPLRLLGRVPVNDRIGGTAVLVLGGAFGAAFGAEHEGRRLSFDLRGIELVDRETGSTWDRAGRAIVGPLAGVRLEPLPATRAYWFSLALARPGIDLYAPSGRTFPRQDPGELTARRVDPQSREGRLERVLAFGDAR